MMQASIEFTRLIFLRHGQIDSNNQHKMAAQDEEPLNATGVAQVEKAAKRLTGNLKPDLVFCSPLYRAAQSAGIASKPLGLQPQPMDELREVDFGEFNGLTAAEISARYPELYQQWQAFVHAPDQHEFQRPTFPGGETYTQLRERIERLTAKLLAAGPGKTILAVAHGGIIKCAMMVYAGGSFERSVPFAIDNASLSVVDFYENKPMIRLVNDISHLGMELKHVRTRLL